jgi:hypothetical protein
MHKIHIDKLITVLLSLRILKVSTISASTLPTLYLEARYGLDGPFQDLRVTLVPWHPRLWGKFSMRSHVKDSHM